MNAYRLQDPRATLRYLDHRGEAPACVYLHGLGAASTVDFAHVAQAPELRHRRSLLIDFLGFGQSDRPPGFDYLLESHARVVASLLDHLGLRRCALIGHSMGGSIAITLAAVRPDLVERLVVAEGNLDPGGGMVSQPIAAQSEDEFVREGYDSFLRVLEARPEWSGYAQTVRAADRVGLYRSAVSLLRGTIPTMRERFQSATIPRTFLFGELSPPDEDLERLPNFGIRVHVVPAAGHGMMHDNPQGFVTAVAAALLYEPPVGRSPST